jgi:hypothetical protein
MGWACGTYGGRERCAQGFWWGNRRERDHWGDQNVDGITVFVFFIVNDNPDNEYRQSFLKFFFFNHSKHENKEIHIAFNENRTHYFIKEYRTAYFVSDWTTIIMALGMLILAFVFFRITYLLIKDARK